MNVLIIEPGKKPRAAEIEQTLEAMQAVVGGYIQAIYPFDEPVALICHKEGKLLSLPLNRALHCPDTGDCYDIIAGTFFLCAAPPDSDHFESLTDEQMAHFQERFHHPEQFINLGDSLLCIPVEEAI